MFKDSAVTRLTPWAVHEEADIMPVFAYPAYVGSALLGVGLDAGGLQSLPESMGDHFHCPVLPFHHSQGDLYVLHEGMVSSHLWDDEAHYTGAKPQGEHARREGMRNYMPLGWLDQTFEFHVLEQDQGDLQERQRYACLTAAGLRPHARFWRRDWSLQDAEVKTSYELGNCKRFPVAITAFAPHGGERLYLRLRRGAAPQPLTGSFTWTLKLVLQTRHGLRLFDAHDSLSPAAHTLLAATTPRAEHTPVEPYTVLYGAAAAGATVAISAEGLRVAATGDLATAQDVLVCLVFRRFAGPDIVRATVVAELLEDELAGFTAAAWADARARHRADWAAFWARTGDIGAEPADSVDCRRRWLLHMSEYLGRCGNEYGLGGNVQYLLMHQNGWRACAFHDQHYIIDGLLRANLWDEAERHLHWLLQVMRPEGRPFPWMLTYDGASPLPPETDRAPLSDANRALLACRIYESCGWRRRELLQNYVYPIVRRVADYALSDWFYEENGQVLFKPVECDVMHDVARVSEAGTVAAYLAVLRKAVAYSELLGVDADRCAAWTHIADGIRFETTSAGFYRAWHGAADDATPFTWFLAAPYIAEVTPFVDVECLRRTRDCYERLTPCNLAWLNSIAACSEIRLGRPDRAEQFMIDCLENYVHGPGYFEEVTPNGISSLPPLATAHGAYTVAVCEQLVTSDFWSPAVHVGRGLPARLRTRHLTFRNLRARGGLLVSGESTPLRLCAELFQDGDAQELIAWLRIPAGCSARFEVRRDGQPVAHTFAGEEVAVALALAAGARTVLDLSG